MNVDELTEAQVRAALKEVLKVHGPMSSVWEHQRCAGSGTCDRWPCSTMKAIERGKDSVP